MKDIADTPSIAMIIKKKNVGTTKQKKEIIYQDATNHRRLQIDTRKWLLSKLLPKKYGDKLEISDNRADPLTELLNCWKKESKRIGPPEEN